MRSEAEVFSDLAAVCQSEGYAHALAYLCFRDNIVRYSGELSAEDMRTMFSPDRLIRTEISALIGLMVQADISWAKKSPDVVQQQIDRTEVLLKELHQIFLPSVIAAIAREAKTSNPDPSLLGRGEFLREAIFYSGESAYNFQYRELAPQKYGADDAWLKVTKGFSIFEARDIARAVARYQEQKLMARMAQMAMMPPEEWSLLAGYAFSASDIAKECKLPESTVEAMLNAFALPSGETNKSFRALDDFNTVNPTPLLRLGGEYVLFQSYSLVEALYESPFYWMAADRQYINTAMQNRGRFTEAFCRDRLELIFGKERVHTNVDIFESKATKIGEIDVLVLFGDRAIVVQAKSKRLTLESRKGNDGRIRDDFKKSVQDSYDQGLICAQRLTDPRVTLVAANGQEIVVPRLREIYVLCVISDHYPSLHFQTRQFLKYEQTGVIQPPLVLDVFALDVITEMLPSPLRFLSYVNRRVLYTEKLMATHETVILSYHLRHNLCVESDVSMLMLDDDISADLDVAMAVRRDGVNGSRTPDGILTRLTPTAVGHIITAIENRPEPDVIDFGFLLLAMSEKANSDASEGIDRIARLARADHKVHDLSIGFDSPKSGFTIHCSNAPVPPAVARLRHHCERRKYAQRANSWFGVCIHPNDQSLRFGFKLDEEWRPDPRLEEATRGVVRSGNHLGTQQSDRRSRKVGRNDPCPCGSGKKYKKCCGR